MVLIEVQFQSCCWEFVDLALRCHRKVLLELLLIDIAVAAADDLMDMSDPNLGHAGDVCTRLPSCH